MIAAIDTLAAQRPIAATVRAIDQLEGEWLMVSAPNFPGGERLEDGRCAYTLGRLSFNSFAPKDLRLVIDRVIQPVRTTTDDDLWTYDIVVEFTVIDPRGAGLQGIVRNLAIATPIGDQTLEVSFTGGTLEPSPSLNADEFDRWKTLFAETTSPQAPTLKQRFSSLLFKLMFGLQPVSPIDTNGRREFKMTRSPRGKLPVIYLDDELRIVRGDQGVRVVATRL